MHNLYKDDRKRLRKSNFIQYDNKKIRPRALVFVPNTYAQEQQ